MPVSLFFLSFPSFLFFSFPTSSPPSNRDPGLPGELNQRPVPRGPRRVVPAAEELPADEHARDRRRAGLGSQALLDRGAVVPLVELPDGRRGDSGLAQRGADGVLGLDAEGAVGLGEDFFFVFFFVGGVFLMMMMKERRGRA